MCIRDRVNVNDGNRGAYGIEAKFEEELAGEPGRVVTAKNAAGTEMLSSYENYIDAQPGLNPHLTCLLYTSLLPVHLGPRLEHGEAGRGVVLRGPHLG